MTALVWLAIATVLVIVVVVALVTYPPQNPFDESDPLDDRDHWGGI